MNEKEKSLLIRISQSLSDEIAAWADKVGQNKSLLVRNSIRYYFDYLSSENSEVLELIKGIIITKIDKVQTSYNDGKLVAFTRIIRISTTLSCNLCRDENEEDYVVYNIVQRKDQSMVEAIHKYAAKLYDIWRSLSEDDKKKFLVDLQMNYVYFSIQAES